MTYPTSRVIALQRDGVRRLSQIDVVMSGSPKTLVSNLQYRADNQLTQRTFGNGLIDQRQYDLQGRLSNQLLRTAGNLLVDQRLYSYDKNSNLLDIGTDAEDAAYLYDALDRLASDAIDLNAPFAHTYDLNDNRLSKINGAEQSLHDYANNSNRLRFVETFSTAATPLTAHPNRDLIYNDASRLYQLIEDGQLKATYLYSASGQRTEKTIHHPDATTTITLYHYDLQGRLIAETDETGTAKKETLWDDTLTPVAQIDTDIGETLSYLHTDHLMTQRLATDDTQAIVWKWQGEAFGNTPAEELAGVQINIRFPGQYFDEETNLSYNEQRYYNSETGRYITSDPIGLDGGINTYLYVFANPLRYSDPSGLRGGCGPGSKPVPMPGNEGSFPDIARCVPDPTESRSKKICVTAECAAGILPNPKSSPKTKCVIACNLKWGPACLAIGGGGKVLGGFAAGLVAGGTCNIVKYLACKAGCSEDEPEQCPVN